MRPAASSRSVWRHRKAGICSTSTASATARALLGLVHVGQHRQAERLAHLGEDRQAVVQADAARAAARWCGWPCRTRSCRSARCRAAPRSPSAPRPSPAHARGFPAGTGRRSAPAAGRCRSAPRRWRRSGCGGGLVITCHSTGPRWPKCRHARLDRAIQYSRSVVARIARSSRATTATYLRPWRSERLRSTKAVRAAT